MSFFVYRTRFGQLYQSVRRTKILVVSNLLIGLSILTACGGAPAFADEPEPQVLPPTTATRPPGTEIVADSEDAVAPQPQAAAELPSLPKPEVITNKHCQAHSAAISDSSAQDTGNDSDVTPLGIVNIGVLAPTSRSVAEQAGMSMVTSANLARGDINEATGILGREVRLVTGDTQGDPMVARQEAIRLILEECVVGLVGVYHSSVALEIKEVAREYGIPVIFAEPFNDDIVADRYPEVFRVGPSARMVNLGYARWVNNVGDFNQDGSVHVTVIAENTSRTIERIESLTDVMTEFDLTVKPLLVDLDGVDFSSVIARIVQEEKLPDFVFIWFNGNSGYILMKALNGAGISPANRTLVVARKSALEHERFWQEMPNGVQTVVSKIGPWYSTVTDIGQAFAERYQTIYGYWPESYAFESYDAVWLLADAINRAGTTEPIPVIEALENANIELASGRYCFPQGSAALGDAPNGAERPPCGYSGDHMWHQWPYAPVLFLQYTDEGQKSEEMSVIWPQSFQNSISTLLTEEK